MNLLRVFFGISLATREWVAQSAGATRLREAMMRNAIVRPDRRSVQKTALRSTDHHFVTWSFMLSFAASGDYDGGSGDPRDPYNDPSMGSALPSRIRKAGSHPDSIQPVLEQSGGTGHRRVEATNPADVSSQAIQQRAVTISVIELAEKIKKGPFKRANSAGAMRR
jgi:hypothetical protein